MSSSQGQRGREGWREEEKCVNEGRRVDTKALFFLSGIHAFLQYIEE